MADVWRDSYVPTQKQKLFHESTANEVLYGGAAGGGKQIDIREKIMTRDSIKTMGEIVDGDEVFGRDGKLHTVTKASEIKLHDAYKLTFDDGCSIVCDEEHLWFTYTASDMSKLHRGTDEYRESRRGKRPSCVSGGKSKRFTEILVSRNRENKKSCKDEPIGSVKTTGEIVATLKTQCGARSNHAIPVCEALDFPERAFPLDPYLLGLWLGDGHTNEGAITGIDGLEKAFSDAGFMLHKRPDKPTWGIYGLRRILKEMHVFGDKNVPESYYMGSKDQRQALLMGLMDTDGSCNKNGSAEFTNTNKGLVDSVSYLIRSLGMKCAVTEGRAKLNGKDCGAKYRIKFMPTIPVFRMQRKLERQKASFRTTLCYRYIVSAERVEPVLMRCIAIDSPDHLYLAGMELIVTHNSRAIVQDAFARCMYYKGSYAYLFRRTYPELDQTLIKEALRVIPPWLGKYCQNRREFSFPNGSMMYFRHCESEKDLTSYQGAEIDFLYFDELTHFTKPMYDYIKTRMRSKESTGIEPCVRCASNPGSVGHAWVKHYFVDVAPYGEIYKAPIYISSEKKYVVRTRQYIPALVTDNPYINKSYIVELEQKPESLRRALLNGDWDAFEGQVFDEFKDDPAHYLDQRYTHVIAPFDIPYTWRRYRGFDLGYSKPFAVVWAAVSPNGTIYVYREWYGSYTDENVGMKIPVEQIARGIRQAEELEIRNGCKIIGYADPSIFDESRGESTAVVMAKAPNYVFFEPGDNTRMAGKMQFHSRFRFDESGKPGMYIASTCKNLIRTLKSLPYSMTKVEDVDTDAEDHAYDALRYVLMAYPSAEKEDDVERTRRGTDPLNQF